MLSWSDRNFLIYGLCDCKTWCQFHPHLWECSGMGQQLWLMTSHDPEDYSFSINFNSSNSPLFAHEQRFSRRSTTRPCLHGQGRRQSELCLPWEWPTKITKDTKDQFYDTSWWMIFLPSTTKLVVKSPFFNQAFFVSLPVSVDRLRAPAGR